MEERTQKNILSQGLSKLTFEELTEYLFLITRPKEDDEKLSLSFLSVIPEEIAKPLIIIEMYEKTFGKKKVPIRPFYDFLLRLDLNEETITETSDFFLQLIKMKDEKVMRREISNIMCWMIETSEHELGKKALKKLFEKIGGNENDKDNTT